MDKFSQQMPSLARTCSLEQFKNLKRAIDLLAKVQMELYKEDEAADCFGAQDRWRALYRIRCELGRAVYALKPDDWWKA